MSVLGVTVAKPWPEARIVHAALRGTVRGIFHTENGHTVEGVRSTEPWVFLGLTVHGPVLFCERCGQVDGLPDPPQATTGTGQPQGNLFERDTRPYALYVMTVTLYPFFRKHEKCKRTEPWPAPPQEPIEGQATAA